MSCGEVHSQAREMATEGYTATLVAATLAISRSSLYYRKWPRGSQADRTYDEQIVMACGEKLAYGYRRVASWLQRKKGLPVNRKRVLRVMREHGLLVRPPRLRARRRKEWGRKVIVLAAFSNTQGAYPPRRCVRKESGCPFANLPENSKGRWGEGLTAADMEKCVWLKPKLVAAIEYAEWTPADHLRHSHSLRYGTIKMRAK